MSVLSVIVLTRKEINLNSLIYLATLLFCRRIKFDHSHLRATNWFRDRAGGWSWGPPPPPLTFSDGFTMVTEICHLPHKEGLVIWQSWTPQTENRQTLSWAVANEFVALNDNRKGNFGTFQIRLKNVRVTLNRFVCGPKSIGLTCGLGCNLLF